VFSECIITYIYTNIHKYMYVVKDMYSIVKNFGSKKVWQVPSLKKLAKKCLVIPIIFAKVFTFKVFYCAVYCKRFI